MLTTSETSLVGISVKFFSILVLWTKSLRIHPVSLALRYLKGQKTMRAAPFHGKPLFEDDAAAIAVLYEFTGQQFGEDAAAWGEWLRSNRAVYSREHVEGIWATVTKCQSTARWTVETDDGTRLNAVITAKVRTTKTPTLQLGDRVRVQITPSHEDNCSIVLSMSPVVWVPSSERQTQ